MIVNSNLTSVVSSNNFLKTEVYDNKILSDMLTFVVNVIPLKKVVETAIVCMHLLIHILDSNEQLTRYHRFREHPVFSELFVMFFSFYTKQGTYHYTFATAFLFFLKL